MVSARQVSMFLSVAIFSTFFFFPHTTFACEAGEDIGGGQCRIFLSDNFFLNQSWMVPGDWTDTNTIECIGEGGGGDYGFAATQSGGGGGGGAYAKSVNLTGLVAGTRVIYNVSFNGTWFNASSTLPTSGQACAAQRGNGADELTGGAGGSAASSYAIGPGSVKYSGGDGADGDSGTGNRAGGGGGGAAGPQGDGNDASGSTGGSGDAGVGGAGGTADESGEDGDEWEFGYGSGGGGGGGFDMDEFFAGDGGFYGGGGGGGAVDDDDEAEPGGGANGLIVVTYTSTGTTTKHQNIQTFTSSGTFTVPSGVTGVTLEGWGGGGGGTTNNGSGGGGAYSLLGNLAVSAGQQYTVTVGAGGAAGGSNGGTTTVVRSGTTYLQAQGGRGGGSTFLGNPGSTNFLIGDFGNNGGFGSGVATGDWSGGGGAGSEPGSFAFSAASGNCTYSFGGDYFGGSSCGSGRESLYGAGGASQVGSADAGTTGLARVTYYTDVTSGFPIIKNRYWDRGQVSDTIQAINLPDGYQPGDLLLVIVTAAASSSINAMTFTTPSGWTLLANQTNSNVLRLAAYYKVADGSEGNAVFVNSNSVQYRPTSFSYRITNYTGIPTASVGTTVTPPQHSTSQYGKNLFITAVARKMDNVSGVRSVTVPPSSYTDFIYNTPNITSGSTAGTWTSDLAVSDRFAQAILETPGAYTTAGSVSATASLTIGIPGIAATSTPRIIRLKGGSRFLGGTRIR